MSNNEQERIKELEEQLKIAKGKAVQWENMFRSTMGQLREARDDMIDLKMQLAETIWFIEEKDNYHTEPQRKRRYLN